MATATETLRPEGQEKQLIGNDFQNAFVQAMTETIIRFRDSQAGEPGEPGKQRGGK